MTHRVHTILSLLAEDHAPAALRPSILLAVDWPTVAEEAPATGDDSGIACAASGILSGIGGRENLPALTLATLPLLAARLATVAASLTATGDKAMTAHATALWGAAAALAGLPTTAPPVEWAELIAGIVGLTGARALPTHTGVMLDAVKRWHETHHRGADERVIIASLATKAADIIPGVIASGPAEKAALIATALDRVHEYRNSGAAEAFDRGVKIRAALGIMPGDDILRALAILRETLSAHNSIGIMSAASMRVEDLGLARQGRDRALAECAALREQLLGALGLETSLRTTARLVAEVIESLDEARNERDAAMMRRNQMRAERDTAIDTAARIATERDNLRASLTVMEAEVSRCNATIASTAAAYSESRIMLDKIAALVGCDQTREGVVARVREAVAGNTGTLAKPRPQPGDVVPWAEVEDGALYFATDLAQAGAAADSLLTGLEDCRHALANMTSERDAAQESERTLRAAHFGERLDKASATVAQWPEWKRNILGRTAGTTSKPRPQPGDVVPWAEVESECIYYDSSDQTFLLVHEDTRSWLWRGGQDTVADFLRDKDGWTETPVSNAHKAILVARDLGTDPEAWRKAMREWTANGNKPTSKAAPKAAEDVRPLRDEFTRSIDLTGAWMCLMTGPLGNNGARWSLETTIGNTNNLRMRWPSGCTTTLKDPR